MELPGTVYLFTLAALAVTFVGFSTLVVILRQTLGGTLSKLDILITRIFIQLGFIVAAGALLPPLFFLLGWQPAIIWRVASLIAAVPSFLFAVTYPMRRRGAVDVPTPIIVWIDVAILLAASLVLAWNGVGPGVVPGAGLYAAGLTGVFFLSGWSYLQAINVLLIISRLGGGVDRSERG